MSAHNKVVILLESFGLMIKQHLSLFLPHHNKPKNTLLMGEIPHQLKTRHKY